MSLIDNIIDISIKRSTLGIVLAGFDTLLIIGNSKKEHRVKTYSDLEEVVTDYENTTPEYKAASIAFGQSIRLNKILIGQAFIDEEYTDAYLAIESVNNDFYGVMIIDDDTTPFSDILNMSALIETKNKIFGVSSKDSKILDPADTSSVLSQLKVANRERTFLLFNSHTDDNIFPEAAWFGLMLSKDAGTATWAYKTLGGFGVDDLDSTNIKTIDDKNGNYYVPLSGRDITLTGRMVSGEYIDIIQGLDWLTNQIRTQIVNALVLNDKIPFTNAGIAIIESMLRNSLNAAADRNIIELDSIKVSIPDIRDISKADKAARKLPDVKFEARLSGAIHKVKIQGTVEL